MICITGSISVTKNSNVTGYLFTYLFIYSHSHLFICQSIYLFYTYFIQRLFNYFLIYLLICIFINDIV